MQLIGLPRRESQSAVSILIGEVVHGLVELVGDQSSRLLGPHHELVVLASPERPLFAIVLLVRSMELHELRGRVRDEGFLRDKLLHEGVSQEVAVFLDDLHLGSLGLTRGRRFGGRCYGDHRLHVPTHSTRGHASSIPFRTQGQPTESRRIPYRGRARAQHAVSFGTPFQTTPSSRARLRSVPFRSFSARATCPMASIPSGTPSLAVSRRIVRARTCGGARHHVEIHEVIRDPVSRST
eukprot:scaffold1724_cov341-Pavlova_lutheri.AAC.26